MSTPFENFLNEHNISSFEGSRGISALDFLIKEVGYDSLDDFLRDNPGAIEGLFEFVKTHFASNFLSFNVKAGDEFETSSLNPEVYQCLMQAEEEGNNDIVSFVRDALTNGLSINYYHGRNFYYGPAVSCDSIQEVLSILTKVRCSYDNLGKGFIVYPFRGLKRRLS